MDTKCISLKQILLKKVFAMFQSKMKKHMTGRGESVNGNDGDDEGFESSPDKVIFLNEM